MATFQIERQWRSRLAAAVLSAFLGTGVVASATASAAEAKPADVQKMEAALPDKAPATPKKARKVLVYGNASGFVHSSIPLGEQTVVKLGEKTGAWTATINNDPSAFDNLKDYDAIVLVSTTGNFLLPKDPTAGKTETAEQKTEWAEKAKQYKDAEKQREQNLLDFVQKDGKGLAGIHAATDAYYDAWLPYGDLIGGYFTGHPWHHVTYKINDPNSPITAAFKDKEFTIDDETYRFKEQSGKKWEQPFSTEKVHELTSIDFDKSKIKDSDSRADHNNPISWIHKSGEGRVFYVSHGHSESVYYNPTILQEYLAGIQYALGDLKADDSPTGK